MELKEKGAINQLGALENSVYLRIRKINSIANRELQETDEEVNHALYEIRDDIGEKIRVQKERIKESYETALDETKADYDTIQKDVSDDMLHKKRKHNNLEVNIGLNWINKEGVILLLFGVATAMKYTYSE